MAQWLMLWLAAREVVSTTRIAAALRLPSEARQFQQLTTVLAYLLRSGPVYSLWWWLGLLSLSSLRGR